MVLPIMVYTRRIKPNDMLTAQLKRINLMPNISVRQDRCAIEKAIAQQHSDQPTSFLDYFTLPAHSMDNIELVPLELINSNRDTISKAREAFFSLQVSQRVRIVGISSCNTFKMFVKRVPFFNKQYTKGVVFLSKWYTKG